MKTPTPILSITGSDTTGRSGIQADIKTISDLGGYALTAVSCITSQDSKNTQQYHDLPAQWVAMQAESVIAQFHPKAVKIGLIRDAQTAQMLHDTVKDCSPIVFVPGIHSSDGTLMVDSDTLKALSHYLIPITTVLMMRCSDAQLLLSQQVATDEEMIIAAKQLVRMGAQWVLLRGGHQGDGRLTALLYSDGYQQFFTSYNTSLWQQHGVSSALSSAVAARLGMGDDVPTAISHAHDYMHSQVVYAVDTGHLELRCADLYSQLMSLLAAHYQEAHDVAFYADRLSITTRYLSQVTNRIIDKSPKQVIYDYLLEESKRLLDTTRLTIQEVAIRLGFVSQSSFSKFFHHQSGLTPTQYRTRH